MKNKLDLRERNITDKEIFQLINESEAKDTIIDELNLYRNRITQVSVPSLLNFKKVRALDLTCNPIGSKGIIEIPEDSLLTDLSLKSANMDAVSLIKLLKSKTLKNLNLYDNHISGEDLKHLNIPLNNALESLSIGANPLGDQGVLLLVDKLPHLKRLYIANCQLTDKGFQALLGYSNLQVLFVLNNPITDTGLQAIAHNQSLKELNMVKTQITDQGAKYLFNNVKLESVFIQFNKGVSKQTQECLKEHLDKNQRLNSLSKGIENISINNSMDTEEETSYSPRLK